MSFKGTAFEILTCLKFEINFSLIWRLDGLKAFLNEGS